MAKTGESWTTAARHVRAEGMASSPVGEGGRERAVAQVIQSFRVSGGMTFSARCARCRRWICCGDAEHTGVCVCGHRFRVVFGEENWPLVEQFDLFMGRRCTGCGVAVHVRERNALRPTRELYVEERRYDPWHVVNRDQMQCNRCFLHGSDDPSDVVMVREWPFTFPRFQVPELPPVGIRRLSRSELGEAGVEAERYLFRLFKGERSLAEGIRSEIPAIDVGIVVRAFRDSDDPTIPEFESAEWLSSNMTREEIAALAGLYFETVRNLRA